MWTYIVSGFIILLIILRLIGDRAPSFDVKGKNVFITGGSSGVGKAVAKMLLQKGAQVAIVARRTDVLKEAKEELTASVKDAKIMTISCDVTDYVSVSIAINSAIKEFGGLDVVINCAGFSYPNYFEEIPIGMFEKMMKVNYLGVVYTSRAVVPHMKARGGGRLLFTSSMAGLVGVHSFTGYSPTKFAIRGFAESLQMELMPHNIYCSVICPPDVDTPGFALENETKPIECKKISEGADLFQPEDIAKDVVSSLQTWNFFVSTGFDGFIQKILCAGMAPSSSLLHVVIELFFGGILRVVGLGYLKCFNRICAQEHQKRKMKKA